MKAVPKDQPIMIDAIDSPYANIPSLTELIYHRGLATASRTRTPPKRAVASERSCTDNENHQRSHALL